ncbi:MAG: nicotinamide-nucleotide amidase [Gammaproteobacteria bacterium]|jgi:nicotinamide-nucleotide amidase
MDPQLEQLSRRAGEALLARRWLLATAESCTGGWVAKVVTDIAGSSQWFDRGFVTYTNAAKQDMLGVQNATLDRHGAVSEATVAEMVAGALSQSRADLALAISGIAGPGGGTATKPVGTVCFAWGTRGGPVLAGTERFDGDREAVRRQSVIHALRGALDVISGA